MSENENFWKQKKNKFYGYTCNESGFCRISKIKIFKIHVMKPINTYRKTTLGADLSNSHVADILIDVNFFEAMIWQT